jgi:hypothetical protein
VTSVATAQRLAKIHLLRIRNQGTTTLPLRLAALQACAQDVIEFSFPPFSWTNKYLEIANFRTNVKGDFSDQKTAPVISCEADVCETDPSVYDWYTYEEQGVEATPSPVIDDGMQVSPPTGLAIEDDATTGSVNQTGTTTPRMLVTWTEPQDTNVVYNGSIQIQYMFSTTGTTEPTGWTGPALTHNTDGTWSTGWIDGGSVSGSSTMVYISGITVTEFQLISVQIRSVRSNGATSNWVTPAPQTLSSTQPNFPIGGPVGGTSGPIFTFLGGATLDTLEPSEAAADQTLGHVVTSSISATGVALSNTPSSVLAWTATTATLYDTYNINASFLVTWTGAGAVQFDVYVDGVLVSGSLGGHASAQTLAAGSANISLCGCLTGLTPGTHTIAIYGYAGVPALTCTVTTAQAVCQRTY